jgi:hypothetical protein
MLWNVENIALRNLQILYWFVLRATSGTRVITREKMHHINTNEYKISKFSSFYNISQPNFEILLILTCSF